MAQRADRTSIQVSRETHEKLSDAKPFSSMSFDELLNEMADDYTARGAEI